MLAFVVPLKSPLVSRDWALTSRHFERCLRALCNQTSDRFRVVVVCNERPAIDFQHPYVHYVDVNFPSPLEDNSSAQTTGYEYSRSDEIARKNADKARKIVTGLEYAGRFNPTHSMVVDATTWR